MTYWVWCGVIIVLCFITGILIPPCKCPKHKPLLLFFAGHHSALPTLIFLLFTDGVLAYVALITSRGSVSMAWLCCLSTHPDLVS